MGTTQREWKKHSNTSTQPDAARWSPITGSFKDIGSLSLILGGEELVRHQGAWRLGESPW